MRAMTSTGYSNNMTVGLKSADGNRVNLKNHRRGLTASLIDTTNPSITKPMDDSKDMGAVRDALGIDGSNSFNQ